MTFSIVAITTMMVCMPVGVAESGIATKHNLMKTVVTNYPERACSNCDGYIAVWNCEDIGKRYLVYMEYGEKWLNVRVADCMARRDKRGLQEKYIERYGMKWILDLDDRLWNGPIRPQKALMMPCREIEVLKEVEDIYRRGKFGIKMK